MPSLENAIERLRDLFEEAAGLRKRLDDLGHERSVGEWQDRGVKILGRIRDINQEIYEFLDADLLRYPPEHFRVHGPKLKEFHGVAPFDKSVFIMTKFPDGKTPDDDKLAAVIDEVQKSIEAAGFQPRIATHGYHEWLWHNVELYLLGCARGVAIVEDRYRSEMNPNVALEWGWMKGMAKRVYFLAEEEFAHKRADWQGLISKTFSWERPREGVRTAIVEWLTKKSEADPPGA